MTLLSTNVHSREFKKSYLSGGLYKTPIKTDLDLGRKSIPYINANIRLVII